MFERVCVLSLLAGMALSSGCVVPGGAPLEVVFSPDGKTVAFTWLDEIYIGTPILPLGVLPKNLNGQWAPARTALFPSGYRVDGGVVGVVVGSGMFDLEDSSFAPMFSPDSRHIAFATESRIIVVQPDSSRPVIRIEPPAKDEKIAGLSWSAGGELLYATGQPKGGWTFWRRDVSAQDAKSRKVRCVVFHSSPLLSPKFGESFSLSPSGRWVVVNCFVEWTKTGFSGEDCSILLDLETGKEKKLTTGWVKYVFWKNDAEATCLLFGTHPGQSHLISLVLLGEHAE
jgi:hypothetical protein